MLASHLVAFEEIFVKSFSFSPHRDFTVLIQILVKPEANYFDRDEVRRDQDT